MGYEEKVIDEGVLDKRLMVVESEFGSVLKVLAREGNTLSPVMRQAWETGNLRSLTKNSPAKATGAHISTIGHTTKEELLKHLNETEVANGFANRFLFVCVKRSKILPEGGNIMSVDFAPLVRRLKGAVEYARADREIPFDAAARMLWHQVYEKLSEGEPGMFGSITARAEAQTRRLAMLYAVMAESTVVTIEHLSAALELWRYCEKSARYIFGRSIGDKVADTILAKLRETPEGLTRTAMRDLFDRNVLGARIDRALNSLMQLNLARFEKQDSGAGRPAERWYAVVG